MIDREDFLKNGFFDAGDETGVFLYQKDLFSELTISQSELDDDEVPCLLYGKSPINSGFCVYTGTCFVWINARTPKAATAFAKKIISFEPTT